MKTRLALRSRLESLLAMRGLRIGARLTVGFSLVVGLLLGLVVLIAIFGYLQRESLAITIDSVAAKDSAVGTLKAIATERADYLGELNERSSMGAVLRQGGELQRLDREYLQALAQLKGTELTAREREGMARLDALVADYATAAREAGGEGDSAAATSAFQSRASASIRRAGAEIDRLAESIREDYKTPVNTFIERGRAATILVMGFAGAVLLVVVLVAWGITRGITRPLRQAVEAANRVAAGDLAGHTEARGRDEAADLLRAMGTMNARLAGMVADIRRSAHAIAGDADQVAAGNEQLAARTEEQASSLEETASTLEEFTSTVRQSAGDADEASQLAAEAAGIARQGGTAVDAVVERMTSLSEASRKMKDIVGVIESIAFQTNILALNAAVEAARAGDQGRGFAVVAAEVRALAQRAAASAREIGGLIGTSVEKINAGAELAGNAGGTMRSLMQAVERVSTLMGGIAAASREQSTAIEQINLTMTQMDVVVQKNAAMVTEASAAAHDLNGEAETLVKSVSTFLLPDEAPAAVRPAAASDLPANRLSLLGLKAHHA